MSPDPVTIRLRHDEARISHVGPKSFDIIPSTERKGRMKDIRSAEDELTRLLAADGISMSDKEVGDTVVYFSGGTIIQAHFFQEMKSCFVHLFNF